MTDYTLETLAAYSGQSPRHPVDPYWHQAWWQSCAGDSEVDVFRQLPFVLVDAGTSQPHDYPRNPLIGVGRVR
jgi:hypothetical protein